MADIIVTQDPTKPGVNKINGPVVTNGKIDTAGLSIAGANANDVLTFSGGAWVPVAPSGVESASNLGAGAQVFKSKVGTDFQFRSILSGSNITVTQNANDISIALASTGIITQLFISSAQALTAGGALTLAHGLSTAPVLIQGRLRCSSADSGYSAGDEVIMPLGGTDENNAVGVAVVPDATNLNCRYGSAVRVVSILNKSNGNTANIDITKWSLILRAWA